MKKLIYYTITGILCTVFTQSIYAQTIYSDGAVIRINNGAVVHSNGGVVLTNSTNLANDGTLITTKSSSAALPGNFEIRSNSNVDGNGIYRVEQNWVNDATFIGGNGEVVLFGNEQQFITSDNGTATFFNHLTLEGVGIDIDRRKTLLNVDGATLTGGILTLNDRELSTQNNVFVVQNEDLEAILLNTTFNGEGFVSSTGSGALIRKMSETEYYLFPVGSSDDVRRYRPVKIQPNVNGETSFAVRMNNYSASNDGYQVATHDNKIDYANELFYHSIEQVDGAGNADLRFYYVPTEDAEWNSTGHWNDMDQQWNNMLKTLKTDQGNFTYITKKAWDGIENGTQYILVNNNYTLIVSEAFSPNGDGLNDFFTIDNLEAYPDSELWIYNRWGAEVFHSDDYLNDWDGRSQSKLNIGGDELPEGTYYYLLQLGGSDDQPGSGDIHKGFIYLKR